MGASPPRVLVVTNMWPEPGAPTRGSFVRQQVEDVRAVVPDWTIDVTLIDGRRGRLEYLRSADRLRRRLRDSPYDLVHAHYGLTGTAAALQASAPVVVTLHGSDVYIPWQRWVTRLGIARARRAIFVSQRLRVRAGLGHAPDHRTAVIPCGVDMDVFRPEPREDARRRLGLEPGGPVALFAGHPAKAVKNYPLFTAALDALPAPWRGRVTPLALRDVPPSRVPDYVNASDAVLVLSHYEGAGSLAKEALACDTPVVAVEVGDVPELIGPVDGCHVVARSAAAVAEAVAAALERAERGERVEGRSRLEEAGVTAGAVARRVVDVYRQVLAAR